MDTAVGIGLIAFGIYSIALGVYILAIPSAEQRVGRNHLFRTGLIPIRFLWAAIPEGIALLLVGLATAFPSRPVSDWFMGTAGFFILAVIIVVIWSPDWIRPSWARRRKA